MTLGLIAGNGRFPFLVLDAARALGHDVTIVAVKEEAFSELNDAAKRHDAPIHWISLNSGRASVCFATPAPLEPSWQVRSSTRRSSAASSRSHVHIGAEEADVAEHRRVDWGGRRRDGR